jgi:hypothetical protein
MTVMFGDEMHWPNGWAFKVLDAMGLPTDSNAGKASIADMKAGVERARKTLTGDDLEHLERLAALVETYERDGETHMEWY